MPTEIIDLGALLPKPKKVQFEKGGPIYTLPGEIPAPLYLRFKQEAQEAAENPDEEHDGIVDVYEQVLALFQIHQPELEELPVGMLQLLKLIPHLYGGGLEAEEADEGTDPPKPTRAPTGKRATRSKRTKPSA